MQNTDLLLTLSVALAAALFLGFLTQRLNLSPIVGYLLAGILVGPHTPGFVANQEIAHQLATVGVTLLLFGIGLHFRIEHLWAVRFVSLPGALIQSTIATLLGVATGALLGWPWLASVFMGAAISVCSTVVMSRGLLDNWLADTPQGRVAVGWAVVEDLIAILALVLLPAIAGHVGTGQGVFTGRLLGMLAFTLGKLLLFAALMAFVGARAIPWLLVFVARSRSSELFTLAVLVIALGIAAGAALLFGASIALGALVAGIVVGQSKVSYQAAADALPLRDAFAVLFFVSVGMLFDPSLLVQRPGWVLAFLALVMVAKPLAGLTVGLVLSLSSKSAITVALCIAQIGEFSFVLAEIARSLGVAPPEGHSVLVAVALISITLNPLLLRASSGIEGRLRGLGRLWRFLNRRAEARARGFSRLTELQTSREEAPGTAPASGRAIVVGYGPVGRTVVRILEGFEIKPVIIELNVETVAELAASGKAALYGDASRREILKGAGIEKAAYLIVTPPDLIGRMPIILTAKMLNPQLQIVTRARYIQERTMLEEAGATVVCYEEAEAATALAEAMLRKMGAAQEAIDQETERIRQDLSASRPGRGL